MHQLIVPATPRIEPVHYHADACFVVCFDQNFWDQYERASRYLKSARGWQWVDPVVTPGGGKSFSSPSIPAKREALFADVDTSMSAHGTKKIVVSTHEKCAAYGEIFQQGGRVEEFRRHFAEHQAINAALCKHYNRNELDEIIHLYISCDGVVELNLTGGALSDIDIPSFFLAA